MDFLGLRWSGAWSQIIDQPQDFSEQVTEHCHLGQLKGDVTSVNDDLGTDLGHILPQRGERSVLDVLRQSQ